MRWALSQSAPGSGTKSEPATGLQQGCCECTYLVEWIAHEPWQERV